MVEVKFNPILKVSLDGKYPAEAYALRGSVLFGIMRDVRGPKNFEYDISSESLRVQAKFNAINIDRVVAEMNASDKVCGLIKHLVSGRLDKKQLYQGLRAEGVEDFDVQKSFIGGWHFYTKDGVEQTLGEFIIAHATELSES